MNRPGHRILPLALLGLLAGLGAGDLPAQDPSSRPFARLRLDPEGDGIVGAPRSIIVEVLGPTWFLGTPRFPDLEIPDAVTIFVDRGANLTERIGGESWGGISRSYTVYPQRPGTTTIPAIEITVRYADPNTRAPTELTITPPEFSFRTTLPPAVDELDPETRAALGDGPWIATPELRVEDGLDREDRTIPVGGSIRRTVTVTVRDTVAMVLPPLSTGPFPGLAAYPDPPLVEDRGGERGDPIVGVRTESVTYIAERTGTVTIPGHTWVWWNRETANVERTSIDPVELTIVPAEESAALFGPDDDEASASAGSGGRTWFPLRGLGVAVAITILGLGFGRRKRRAPAPPDPAAVERAAFRHLERALESGDRTAVVRTLYHWLDRIPGAHPPERLDARLAAVEDPVLRASVEAVLETRYGPLRSDASGTPPLEPRRWRALRRRPRRVPPPEETLSLNPDPSPRERR